MESAGRSSIVSKVKSTGSLPSSGRKKLTASGTISQSDFGLAKAANNLRHIALYLLQTPKYQIACKNKVHGVKVQAISLVIHPQESSDNLDEGDMAVLMSSLKRELGELGEQVFENLVKSHEVVEGTYRINLDLTALRILEKDLLTLIGKLGEENSQQTAIRTGDSVTNKLQAAVDAAKKDFDARIEGETDGLLHSRLKTMYTVKACFEEALISDVEFQKALNEKGYNFKKCNVDAEMRQKCFTHYLKRNPHFERLFEEIFNHPNPQITTARYAQLTKYCNTLIDQFAPAVVSKHDVATDVEKGLWFDALKNVVLLAYVAVKSKTEAYIQQADRLVTVCDFLVGYTNTISYELCFEKFDPDSQTASGQLQTIMLKVEPSDTGSVNDQVSFNNFVLRLEKLLGTEQFAHLVQHYDIESFSLTLNSNALLEVNTKGLLPSFLAPQDLEMHQTMLLDEEALSDHQAKCMLRDTLKMYVVYVEYQREFSFDKVALTLDPEFNPETTKAINDFQVQHKDLITFLIENPKHLNTIKQIFPNANMLETANKFVRYGGYYRDKAAQASRYAMRGNTPIGTKWYQALERLVGFFYWASMQGKLTRLHV